MLLGFGWCHLRTSRDSLGNANRHTYDAVDKSIDAADGVLYDNFENWLEANDSPWVVVQFVRGLNNHTGLLTWTTSRNHRPGHVWPMLRWIAENGHGSYGLFYVHDDEDSRCNQENGETNEFDNVFRAHQLRDGKWIEHPDPFFGPVIGGLEPPHYLDRHAEN